MWSIVIIVAFALMILTPCVIAFAGSRSRNESEPYAERSVAPDAEHAMLDPAPAEIADAEVDDVVVPVTVTTPMSPAVAAAVARAQASAAEKQNAAAEKQLAAADQTSAAPLAAPRGNWHENSLEEEVARTEAEFLVAQAAAAHAAAQALAAQARAAQAKANAALAAAAEASEVAARATEAALQTRHAGDDATLDQPNGSLDFGKAKAPRRAA